MVIKSINDVSFPPVGGNKPFQVTCDGKPFAGFDTYKEAESALETFSRPVRTTKRTASFNSLRDWRIVCK